MKKNLVKIILIILLSVTIIPSCKINLIGQTKYKVGILIPEVSNGKISKMAYSAAQRCEELTDQIEYKIYTSKDVESMITQLDKLLQWNADLIVVYPKWTEMQNPIKRAIGKGVVVVNFETELEIEGVYQVLRDKSVKTFKETNYKVDDNEVGIIRGDSSLKTIYKLRKKNYLETVSNIVSNTIILVFEATSSSKSGFNEISEIVIKSAYIDSPNFLDDEKSFGVIKVIKNDKRIDIKFITAGSALEESLKMITLEECLYSKITQYSPTSISHAIDMGLSVLKNGKVSHIEIISKIIVDKII
ncbi:MAG: hypothetical protein OWP43_06735 [Sphaerochaetaceae bacterium]|nr:hypothetical protein [Sphaerochaetaceae bacterium]